MKTPVFKVYLDKAGEWRWKLLARNGRTVADSGEGYRSKRGAVRSISSTMRAAIGAEVEVESG